MNIEITPEESRLICNLLVSHRVTVIQSLEKYQKYQNGYRCKLSDSLKKSLDNHISFLESKLQQIDSLVITLQEVHA